MTKYDSNTSDDDSDDNDDYPGGVKFIAFRRLSYRNTVLSITSRLTDISLFTLRHKHMATRCIREKQSM